MARAIPTLALSFLGFVAVESLVFHTDFYPYILSPDSTTGFMETVLDNEHHRPKQGPNEILAIGDSRMALMPRFANAPTGQPGYTFASIAVGGSTARCWYYQLRDADPTANAYAAVMITIDNYDDMEVWEDLADWPSDLHYLLARLRLSDLSEYVNSYHSQELKWEAARGILFKGLVFKRDFADFLKDPVTRWKAVDLNRRESFHWIYDYVPTKDSMSGVSVDFVAKTVTVPPERAAQKAGYEVRFLRQLAPYTGRQSAYFHYWLGKIYEHYRGSHTRLVFVREPRGPFVRPDFPPSNPHSSIHELAAHPEVSLVPEHYFDVLERPELFMDEAHLNGPGVEQFSHMMAKEMIEILGPPK